MDTSTRASGFSSRIASSMRRASARNASMVASTSTAPTARNSKVREHSAGTVLTAMPPSIWLTVAVVKGTS